MNPFVWRREHQVAIILGAIVGAVIVVVIGFMRRGLDYGTLTSALFWSASTARWAILGALIRGLSWFTCDGFCGYELDVSWGAVGRRVIDQAPTLPSPQVGGALPRGRVQLPAVVRGPARRACSGVAPNHARW